MTAANLGAAYLKADRSPEAIELLEKTLDAQRKMLGAGHPNILQTVSNLLYAFKSTERFGEMAAVCAEHSEFLSRAEHGSDSDVEAQLGLRLSWAADQLIIDPVGDDKTVARYYADHEESFRADSVHLHMITMARGDTEEKRAAQHAQMMAMCEQITNLESFAEAARAHSEDAWAEKGGDRGWVERGDFKAYLEQAIFAVKPGAVGTILKDETHLRVLRVEERKAGPLQPLDQVRDQIVEILKQKKREELMAQWRVKARQIVDDWEKENKGTMISE
jgi:hypothetical protein